MKTTMIQLKKETAEKLRQLKDYSRQSYDELINRLIEAGQSDTLTERDIEEIKQGLDDIRAGKTRPIEHVAKDLGITLRR